eukprot:9403548-Pyramimonas_sp.AAC.1
MVEAASGHPFSESLRKIATTKGSLCKGFCHKDPDCGDRRRKKKTYSSMFRASPCAETGVNVCAGFPCFLVRFRGRHGDAS